MHYLHSFLIVLAAVLFFLGAVPGAPIEPYRLRVISAGLFCWAVSEALPLN